MVVEEELGVGRGGHGCEAGLVFCGCVGVGVDAASHLFSIVREGSEVLWELLRRSLADVKSQLNGRELPHFGKVQYRMPCVDASVFGACYILTV